VKQAASLFKLRQTWQINKIK